MALYLPANAQLSFGIKGGVNQAWFNEQPSDAPKLNGLGTTLMLYKRVNKFLEIGMEPGVVQRGTTQPFNQNYYYPYNCFCCFGDCLLPINSYPYNSSSGLRATYAQLPIMARSKWPLLNGNMAIFLKAGGGPSWLAAGYYDTQVYDEATFQTVPENKALDFSEENSPRRWDFGLYSGAGLGYNLGCGMLTFETEYYHGLRDVTDYVSFKNRSITYSLGYIINL